MEVIFSQRRSIFIGTLICGWRLAKKASLEDWPLWRSDGQKVGEPWKMVKNASPSQNHHDITWLTVQCKLMLLSWYLWWCLTPLAAVLVQWLQTDQFKHINHFVSINVAEGVLYYINWIPSSIKSLQKVSKLSFSEQWQVYNWNIFHKLLHNQNQIDLCNLNYLIGHKWQI